MKRKIKKNIYIGYLNELNEFHQEDDKPSFIGFSGTIYFDKKGKLDRKGKPSIINSDVSLKYFEDDKFVKGIHP